MKRMHEFLNPNISEWNEHHTGTGVMTQDGTVICTNDEDLINANESTVYQFDHFDKATGKYIYKLVSNQFTLPSASVENYKDAQQQITKWYKEKSGLDIYYDENEDINFAILNQGTQWLKNPALPKVISVAWNAFPPEVTHTPKMGVYVLPVDYLEI